jgi:alanine racemase
MSVGYGAEYVTKRPTRTAVIPLGFADGFTLAPEGPVYRQGLLGFAARKMRRSLAVEVRGRKSPVVGRVAMQMTVIDVTGIPDVEVGEEVTVPAMRIPTSALIPRIYVA